MAEALNSGSRGLLCPEARVLLAAIQPALDPAAVTAALREPSLDWDALFTLARREKAIGALAELVDRAPEGCVPPRARAQLAALVRAMQFRMLRLQQLLIGALDTLAERGIDVVLLKGAGVAATVYGSFTARPMYDLDLLVRPEQAEAAWDALRAAGWRHDAARYPQSFYETHRHFAPLDDPAGTGLVLEVHTALTDTAVHLPAEVIWRDARAVELHGRRAFVPPPEQQVLHLAVHFAWSHGLAKASWRTFRDLHQILAHAPPDWDVLIEHTTAARAGTSCYWTLRLARSLAGVAAPLEVMQRLRPPRPERVLRILERHYIASLFPANPAPCPSVQLTQLLWSVGMAPRWSGHGGARPWHQGELWAEAHGADRPLLLERLRGQVARSARWARYFAALVGARPRAAGRPPMPARSSQ
ncbi:MAG TPA: nucleotidyltransferase family protein [Longimicrobiales bacterium]